MSQERQSSSCCLITDLSLSPINGVGVGRKVLEISVPFIFFENGNPHPASTAANEPLLTALFRYTGFSIVRAQGTARKTALVTPWRRARARTILSFRKKLLFLDRCFPMLYLSESRFQNWTRKWLLSDMHGCRRATKIWPARSPSCRPPAAATFSKRRPRARRLTGPSWPK